MRNLVSGRRRWLAVLVIPFVLLAVLAIQALAPLGSAKANPSVSQIDMTPATVHLGVFSTSLALTAARTQGFFAQQNLTVQFMQVSGSIQQFASLNSGQYDLVQTSPDNVANYRYNDDNPLGVRIAGQDIAGLDNGAGLRLVARPGITSVEQLRGKVLGVDALSSGFAYVLYSIMSAHGLQLGVDYQVVEIGGTFARFQALQAGTIAGTLLGSGFDLRAAAAGDVLLDPVSTVANPYMGSVLVGTEGWLKVHPSVAIRFIRAYYAATQWVFDPANKEAAIALLMAQPNTPRSLAEQLYAEQLQPGVGIIPDASISVQAVYNVLNLRQQYNGFEQQLDLYQLATPNSGLNDAFYYNRAVDDTTDSD